MLESRGLALPWVGPLGRPEGDLDKGFFCFLLLLLPQLLRGQALQRAVVGAGLKAGRGGSLHGSSSQAGRKWPCAKAGSGCCQTGRGGLGCVRGRGTSPVERWMGRGSALEGLGCSLRMTSSAVTGRRGVSKEKATFVAGALAGVLPPWDAKQGPGPTTVDQASAVAPPVLGLRMLSLQDRRCSGKMLSEPYLFLKHRCC